MHRVRDLGHGRTLRFERDLHGEVAGAYISHVDESGAVCLTRLAIATTERREGPRVWKMVDGEAVTLQGPVITCRCGQTGRVAGGRWLREPDAERAKS